MKSTSLKLIILTLVTVMLVGCASSDKTADSSTSQKSNNGLATYLH